MTSNIQQECNKHLHLFETVTIGTQRWGDRHFLIKIHGESTVDRDTPHIHVYLKNDDGRKQFNFEISLIDVLSKDTMTLMYQLDREKKREHTNITMCSWTGYKDIFDGLKEYLFGKVQLPHYQGLCVDNLDVAIHVWNFETDAEMTISGGNPMKEWLERHNISILPKYQKYFSLKNIVSDNC